MIVRSTNSLIRWIAAHAIESPEALERYLLEKCAEGKLEDVHEKLWDGDRYRLGGDWLTGTAFDLLHASAASTEGQSSSQTGKIKQFEVGRSSILSALPSAQGMRLAGRDRQQHRFDPPISVGILKAGLVWTGTPVCLVWLDIRLDSDAQEAWSELFGSVQKRSDAPYLHRFVDESGRPCSLLCLMEEAEQWFLGSERDLCTSGRTFQLFARFDLEGGEHQDMQEFAEKLRGGAEAVDEAGELPVTDPLPTRWYCTSETVFAVRWSSENARKPEPGFHNAFQLPDVWLACALAMSMSYLINHLEQLLLRAANDMAVLRGENPLRIATAVLRLQKHYERIMDLYMNAVCILDPGRLHTHAKRDAVYQKIRDTFQIDQRRTRVEGQIERLRLYLAEKRQRLLGWFLAGIPFLSLLIGVFGINVQGITSSEGITWLQLVNWLLLGTGAYVLVIWLTLFALRIRSRM